MIRKHKSLEATLQTNLEKIQEGETLEAILSRTPDQAEGLRPLLEAARWLQQRKPTLNPPPGFVAASRRRLVTRLQSQGRQSRFGLASRRWLYRPTPPSRLALQSALLMIMLFLALVSGRNIACALPTWLPGDWGYPLKTASEEATLALSLSPVGDARLHIDYAQRRLLEAQALVLENRHARLTGTVASFTQHAQNAVEKVNQLAPHNRAKAQELALRLQRVLQGQSDLVAILVGISPQPARADLEQVLLVSSESLSAMKDLLSPDSSSGKTLAALPSPAPGQPVALLPAHRPHLTPVVTT